MKDIQFSSLFDLQCALRANNFTHDLSRTFYVSDDALDAIVYVRVRRNDALVDVCDVNQLRFSRCGARIVANPDDIVIYEFMCIYEYEYDNNMKFVTYTKYVDRDDEQIAHDERTFYLHHDTTHELTID